MDEQYDTESPYKMTVADFLNKLERIRQTLRLEGCAFLPGGGRVAINERDVQNLFRFFSLTGVAEVWPKKQPTKLGQNVFKKLNEFLIEIGGSTYESLHNRWTSTMSWSLSESSCPENEKPVEECIKAVVQNDRDKDALKRHGIEEFLKTSYNVNVMGEKPQNVSIEDVTIESILGVILLWFTALPCNQNTTKEREKYCTALEGMLKGLLDPNLWEFMQAVEAAQDNPALITMQEEHLAEVRQYNKDAENIQRYPMIKVEKEQSYGK